MQMVVHSVTPVVVLTLAYYVSKACVLGYFNKMGQPGSSYSFSLPLHSPGCAHTRAYIIVEAEHVLLRNLCVCALQSLGMKNLCPAHSCIFLFKVCIQISSHFICAFRAT
jgi:hypothetical protein